MNQIQIFENEVFGEIRALLINGEPYLVGKDVAEKLGYSDTDQALRKHVDDEDKLTRKINGTVQNRNMKVINESGFYSLVLGSKLPGAKRFKRWVTSEVLPSIRKTGGYLGTNENMTDEEIMAKALMVAQKTISKKNELLKAKEAELESKNKFINQIAVSENSLLVREVAKIASKANITIGEKRLWNKLREWGLIFKNSTEPKQKAIDAGYFEVVEGSKTSKGSTFTYHTTRVTGKGQAYIINRLVKEA